MKSLIKHSGQVFTPDYLVNIILDEANYYGPDILNKHCIDNSCGDGAFLIEIIRRYCNAYIEQNGTLKGVSNDISTYIHGIEIEDDAYSCCIENLNNLVSEIGIQVDKFDVIHSDALKASQFFGKMDYVVGNPPYVRVHNLNDNYSSVKKFSFASDGMTDLYLVFFELGFKMLKTGGKLCYITPSSWLNSLAGSKLRNYIRKTRSLISLIDLAHFQAFSATTYTLISFFTKGIKQNTFEYYSFDESTLNKQFEANLSINDIDINSFFYLANQNTLSSLKAILTAKTPRYVTVKNGFATLADKIFISKSFDFDEFTIDVIKASTGKWYKGFFPYDENGKPIPKEKIFSNSKVANYLNHHKKDLLKGEVEETNPLWHLYGRTQAIKDVFVDKLSINTMIKKDVKSIKINLVPYGKGIYSGLYIISSHIDYDTIKNILISKPFVNYISSLKKYKSGGYYTFNSKDLELYLNYHIHKLINKGTIKTSIYEQYGLFSYNY